MIFVDEKVIKEQKTIQLSGRGITSFRGKSSIVGELYLNDNQLSSFSAEEGAFPNLRNFSMFDNQITSFSAESGAFPNLKILYLSRNQLTSFIVKEGTFPNLHTLYLNDNPELEILEISTPKLEQLWIRNTKIRFLDDILIKKVKDRKDVEPHEHTQGTKDLVTKSRHQGCPIISEIVDHLTR